MALSQTDFVNEDEIKAAIRKAPDILEEGLFIFGREIPTDSGPMDFLGVDTSGQLVVIEAKNIQAAGDSLIQLLRYLDYVERYRGTFNISVRKGAPKIDLRQPPRGIIVALGFANELVRALRFVERGFVDLSEAFCLQENVGGTRHTVCRTLAKEKEPQPLELPTAEEVLDRISNASIKTTSRSILKWVRTLSEEIEERVKPTGIAFRQRRMFLYLWCQKNAVLLERRTEGKWERLRVKKATDWTDGMKRAIEQSLLIASGALGATSGPSDEDYEGRKDESQRDSIS